MTRPRWIEAAHYMESKGFPKLKEWFLACSESRYEELNDLIKPELTQEWNSFRNRAVKELDIGPWVDRYVKYCVLSKDKDY